MSASFIKYGPDKKEISHPRWAGVFYETLSLAGVSTYDVAVFVLPKDEGLYIEYISCWRVPAGIQAQCLIYKDNNRVCLLSCGLGINTVDIWIPPLSNVNIYWRYWNNSGMDLWVHASVVAYNFTANNQWGTGNNLNNPVNPALLNWT